MDIFRPIIDVGHASGGSSCCCMFKKGSRLFFYCIYSIPKFIGHLNTIKRNNDAPKLGAYDYENRKYVELMLEIDFVLHLLFFILQNAAVVHHDLMQEISVYVHKDFFLWVCIL